MSDSAKPLTVDMEIEIIAPAEKVWAFLASVEGMQSWLGPKVYNPKLGGEIKFFVDTGENKYNINGEVVVFDPPKSLAFTWNEHQVGGQPWPEPTTVTITLNPTEGGTRVTLVHSGFEALPQIYRKEQFDSYVEGWKVRDVMTRLKDLLED